MMNDDSFINIGPGTLSRFFPYDYPPVHTVGFDWTWEFCYIAFGDNGPLVFP